MHDDRALTVRDHVEPDDLADVAAIVGHPAVDGKIATHAHRLLEVIADRGLEARTVFSTAGQPYDRPRAGTTSPPVTGSE
ncbi:hypothetical protein GCM10017691_09150 [Pseudonocardia petroleophila]